MPRVYPYIGPEEIRRSVTDAPSGVAITGVAELRSWLAANSDARSEGCTFVVGLDGILRVAPRRSEHIACAGGEDVLAAGELRFAETAGALRLIEASNQSTGYCPDVDCWAAIARALSFDGIVIPSFFTRPIVFRRCDACSQITLVKEQWFVCAFCDAELPRAWNLSDGLALSPSGGEGDR